MIESAHWVLTFFGERVEWASLLDRLEGGRFVLRRIESNGFDLVFGDVSDEVVAAGLNELRGFINDCRARGMDSLVLLGVFEHDGQFNVELHPDLIAAAVESKAKVCISAYSNQPES